MSNSPLRNAGLAALAAAAATISSAPPAASQPVETYSYSGPPEEVIVTAPRPAMRPRRFREEGGNLDLPPERISLSTRVRYNARELLTPEGAEKLRARVVRAAYRVCRQIDERTPFERLSTSEPCEREAVNNALVRADEAINAAREDYIYSFME